MMGVRIPRDVFDDILPEPDEVRETCGLGTLLFDGLTRDHPSLILGGIIAIGGIALAVDLVFRILERVTPTSRSYRTRR